ncbi:MAG: iron-sulfur cluster assembly protein [Bacteroidales bacterium]|nr:iron-sulfur cluster assembly protein [Bacteroidales bacterium]MDD4209113.1 iron-sulfur cluster assembly protein [Bacteroidales bacterium]
MKSREILREKIIKALKQIYDPEIPVNIWDMGLVYDITFYGNNEVAIIMTLTSPNCPVAESLPLNVKNSLEQISELNKVTVKITFNPPWDMDKLSDEAKLDLGLL